MKKEPEKKVTKEPKFTAVQTKRGLAYWKQSGKDAVEVYFGEGNEKDAEKMSMKDLEKIAR